MQQIDDYNKYWNQIVIPDYDDFFAALDDLRKAFHCASSFFHMADWVYHGNKAYIDATITWLDGNGVAQRVTDEKTFANALRDLNSDFELTHARGPIPHPRRHEEQTQGPAGRALLLVGFAGVRERFLLARSRPQSLQGQGHLRPE